MPPDLTPEVERTWRHLVPRIAETSALTDADELALVDLCVCIVRLHQAEAEIEARGLLVPGERGVVKNPAAQIARDYRASVPQWGRRFGLTPADRARLGLPPPDDGEDPIEAMLR